MTLILVQLYWSLESSLIKAEIKEQKTYTVFLSSSSINLDLLSTIVRNAIVWLATLLTIYSVIDSE